VERNRREGKRISRGVQRIIGLERRGKNTQKELLI